MGATRATDGLSRLQGQAQALAEALKKQSAAQGQPASPLTARLIADTQPRLFVQFAGELNRVKVIDPLRQAIAGKGFVVPPAERINRGQTNEVRYFIDDQATRQSAQQVADLTAAYFQGLGCPIPQIKVRLLTLPDGKQSPTELWLQHSCSHG